MNVIFAIKKSSDASRTNEVADREYDRIEGDESLDDLLEKARSRFPEAIGYVLCAGN